MNFDLAMIIVASTSIVLVTALLACIDTAIMLADDVKMTILLETEGLKPRVVRQLQKIQQRRDRHMTAMTVFMTFLGIASGTYIGAFAYKTLSHTGMMCYLIVITYSNLVVARTLPKVIARHYYESILTRFSWLARTIYYIAMPMVMMTLIWVKIFKLDKARKMNLAELRETIRYFSDKGLLETTETSMLQRIFTLKQYLVGALVQPSDLPSLDVGQSYEFCKEAAISNPGSRILATDNGLIVGVVYYRDLASKLIAGEEGTIKDITRSTVVVADNLSLIEVMAKVQEKKVGQAVVVNALGDCLGVVSVKEMYSHILSNSIEAPLGKVR